MCSGEELQQAGISFRKVGCIKGAASRTLSGEVDLEALVDLPDDEACRTLSVLPGIGVWTVEMLMTFSMQRPSILIWAIWPSIAACAWCTAIGASRAELFAEYRRRHAPYCSVASLHLWEVVGGAIPA